MPWGIYPIHLYPMKFLSRSTSLFLLFNWGMAMTSAADFIGAVVQIPKESLLPSASHPFDLFHPIPQGSSYPSRHPFRRNSFILAEGNHPPEGIHPSQSESSRAKGAILPQASSFDPSFYLLSPFLIIHPP